MRLWLAFALLTLYGAAEAVAIAKVEGDAIGQYFQQISDALDHAAR